MICTLMVAVSVLGSHCALQVLKGAKDESLDTVLVCERRRLPLYQRFGFIDTIIPVDSFSQILDNPKPLKDTIMIPHGTLISQIAADDIESADVQIFGNRHILRWESDRTLKERLMRAARLRVPDTISSPDDIDDTVIVKRQGAAGGRGYFIASTTAEYHTRRNSLIQNGTISSTEPLYIQRYIPGVLAYLQFFYSPIQGQVEFFGCDQRHESDIEGLARIPASNQSPSMNTSFNVIGNSPLILRESLLQGAYEMAERFVKAASDLVPPGIPGPFCIEGVYDAEGTFHAFEFSARIVAGTNIYMDGSPYYTLLYGEPISMGRRISQEIKAAEGTDYMSHITS